MKNLITHTLILLLISIPKNAFAHIGSHLYEPDASSKLAQSIDSITGWILNISMGVGAALVLYAVFLYIAASKNKKNQKANTALTYAIVTLIIGVLVGGTNILLQHFVF